ELWNAEGKVAGRGDLHADELSVRLAKLRTRGAFSFAASFGAYRWASKVVEDARLRGNISHVTFSSERAPSRPLIEAKAVEIDVHTPRLDARDPLRTLRASIRIPEATVADPTLLHEYLPRGSRMRLIAGHAAFALTEDVTIDNHLASGVLEVRAPALQFAFDDLRIDAGILVRARVHAWHWERGDLALADAEVDIARLAMSRSEDTL